MTATLLLSILRDKATLLACCLLHVIKRCFVFLLCAVLFIALCIVSSKRITDKEPIFILQQWEKKIMRNVVGLLFPRKMEKVFQKYWLISKYSIITMNEKPKTNKALLGILRFRQLLWRLMGGLTGLVADSTKPTYRVENDLVRRYSKLSPISYKTFMKYLELVTRKVKERAANEIPEKFALVLDGLGKRSTHRVGIFGRSNWQMCGGYLTVLLKSCQI